ncbi:fibronectin type III domain-containing protein [Zobellia sp. OII3]|uniref:fibronectin type III domain-containing protein n=1 Tax=Zobellia sp. OII3 TaxID=2034520 RepID=UPI0013747435|nr:fibronectin type III domain-containing protein [Zobellia sp. OII3]
MKNSRLQLQHFNKALTNYRGLLRDINCRLQTVLFHALFFFLLTLTCLPATAQSFPVQVIPQVTPPAPIYFSDYADASTLSSPLRVQIVLNDFEIANREIRLRTYFEGGGISFQSNDVVAGAEKHYLEGGVPLILTNVQLAPYFRFENISGISPNVYGKAIPEGAYSFCFEVYDALTGNRLSQKSCATSVVFQNEPPFLVAPRNKSNLTETNPQNIVFQWTPRHINVSNVEYELSIVEIWDTQVDPQQAFLSSPPVFQVTTTATTYVYGPADPLFLSGKNYAWRVQAKAKQGVEEIGLFKNQGYSEIYSFSYAGTCDLPIGINHEVKGSTNANIFWDDFATEVPEYTVRYRQKNLEGAEWFTNKTTSNQTTLWDLKPGTTYEYQVQKQCTVTGSDWSTAKEFTTFIADDEASVYDCGITPDFDVSNKEPLPSISSGEKFIAGDFPVNILTVSGSNGRFTGKGYVTIPYLNNIRVGVEFTNVLINTDKKLAEGTVVTTYDPSLKNILDVDEAIATVDNAVEAVGDLGESIDDILKNVFGEEDADEENAPPMDPEINEGEPDITVSETTSGNQGNTSANPSSGNGTGIADSGTGQNTVDTGNIASTPDTESENTASSGEEVVIVHNGIEYKNGEVIVVPYDKNNSHYAFSLKNHPENATFNWQVLYQGTDYTSKYVTNEPKYDNLGIDMKKVSKLDVVANYNDKKIQVRLKRELQDFELVDIYAKPEDSPKRIAKSGEKLYLVKKSPTSLISPKRKVDFSVHISPDLSKGDISTQHITWYYDTPNTQSNLGKDYGIKDIHLNLTEQESTYSVNVKAGKPDLIEKGIDVVWVEGGTSQFNFLPTGVYNVIVSKYGSLEQIFGIFDDYSIGSIPVVIDPIKVGGSKANIEIPDSRKYKYVEKGYINGGLSVYFDKFFSPPQLVLLERTGVAKIGLTLEFQAGVKLEGGVEKIKIVENDYFENDDPYIKFNPYGCATLKLGAELLVAKNLLEIDIGGDVSSCIGGIIQYKFATEQWEGQLYFDPLVLSGWVKVKSKGLLDFELIEWKDSFKVTDRKSVDFLD